MRKELEAGGIHVRAGRMSGLAEEAPVAYKDVDRVVEVVHGAGIAKKVARLVPVAAERELSPEQLAALERTRERMCRGYDLGGRMPPRDESVRPRAARRGRGFPSGARWLPACEAPSSLRLLPRWKRLSGRPRPGGSGVSTAA